MRPTSAIPDFYYALFAYYEPILTLIGFVGALSDPKTTHDHQAPWPEGGPPPGPLPRATVVTIAQLAHVCALVGIINYFVLSAARKHLSSQPALQERIVFALMTPLVVGDFLHMYVTVWSLGEDRWDLQNWSGMLWITIILGLTLMVPRIAWHMGIGRYVDKRDASVIEKQ